MGHKLNPESANMEAEAVLGDLATDSNVVVDRRLSDSLELVEELRELITLMPTTQSPSHSHGSNKRCRRDEEEKPVREIDQQTQNGLAQCLIRQMQTFEDGLLKKFDVRRESDQKAHQEFSRASVGEIRSLRINTSQAESTADTLRGETQQMMERLAHRQGQRHELLGQCAQQMLHTQTQVNAWDTWWRNDLEEKGMGETLQRESRRGNPDRIGVKKETPNYASSPTLEHNWHSSTVYPQWKSVRVSRTDRSSPPVDGGGGGNEKMEGDQPPDALPMSQGVSNPNTLHKMAAPPKFDPKGFDVWKRESIFWRNIFCNITDDLIIGSISLRGSVELRENLMDFYDECASLRKDPAFNGFLGRIEKGFGAIEEVCRMERTQEIFAFKRKRECGVRRFWREHRTLMSRARNSGVSFPDDVLFSQTLSSLQLTPTQRRLILSHYESTAEKKDVISLQNLTVGLFGTYGDAAMGTFIILAMESENDPGEDYGEEGDIYVLKKRFSRKGKSDNEETSVRKSTSVMNIPNERNREEELLMASGRPP